MQSEFIGPVNIGSEEMVSINDYARMICEIAGKSLEIKNIPVVKRCEISAVLYTLFLLLSLIEKLNKAVSIP